MPTNSQKLLQQRQFVSPLPQFEEPANSAAPVDQFAPPQWAREESVGQQTVSRPLPAPSALTRKRKRGAQKPGGKRGKRLRFWFAVCSVITLIAVVFMAQGNGSVGAWMADSLRAVVGPTLTAQIESWYLGLSNTTHQVQYQLGNKNVAAPWKVSTVVPTQAPRPAWSTLSPMDLPTIKSVITPAVAGEGVWSVLDSAPAPYNYLPLDARAFIRPDPSHPYAIVTLLQFDTRFIRLHIVAGTTEPGGPRGFYGSGVIPAADQQGNNLLAAFNGGFKYADGQYGLMSNGVVYVPPQPGVATIAITREGKIALGAWGVDPLLNNANKDIVAWRQNAALLIDKGVINPLTQDGAAWGGTILNRAYTWRSGIGITAQGTLVYAAGDFLTAQTLGQALLAAGAVMAMQTDINPFWVRAFLYDRDHNGQLHITKLNPQMQGTGYEYLSRTQRDFFYLTRFAPPVPPPHTSSRETTSS
jgi:hypothetical protein